MNYLCSENKGADQLCGYRTADLRLCFRIYAKFRFSHDAADLFFIQSFIYSKEKLFILFSFTFRFVEKLVCFLFFFRMSFLE